MTELQILREFLKRWNQAAGLANPYSSVTQRRTAHLILNHLSRVPLKQASDGKNLSRIDEIIDLKKRNTDLTINPQVF